MSEIPLRFRKKEYEPGTDSVDGVVTFDSSEKKIYLDGNVYGAKNIQSDWNETDTSSDTYIQNKPDLDAALYEPVTYSQLITKIGNSQLVKGKKYRVTDYVTTTAQTNTSSANHAFDLVVTAIGVDKLDHMASALPHDGDTYFSVAGADLSKWKIWYDVNNNTSRYAWADSTNGKGVIYRMIDEWGNDCPYDFKNIQFKRKLTDGTYDETNGTDTWVYTFNAWNTDDSVIEDASLITNSVLISDSSNSCYNNVMGVYRQLYADSIPYMVLNNNVFLNKYSIEDESYFECYSNTFGNDCINNTFGNECSYNTFGNNCGSNTFGNACSYNTFGDICHNNTFGNYCTYNTCGNNCQYISFGNSSNQGGTHCCYNIFENGTRFIRLYNTGTASSINQLQNVYVAQGVSSTSNSYFEISTIGRNLQYRTTVAKLSDGTIRIYREDDPQSQADWNENDTSSESYILNKPTGMAFIGSDYDGESASADSIITNYDFIHTPNTNIGSSSVTVTFAPSQRCTAEYTVSTDISVNIVCNNRADNYIWINNALSTSAVTATLSGITFIGSSVQNIKGATNIPQIPAGGTLEISVVCNSDGAKLASGLL